MSGVVYTLYAVTTVQNDQAGDGARARGVVKPLYGCNVPRCSRPVNVYSENRFRRQAENDIVFK